MAWLAVPLIAGALLLAAAAIDRRPSPALVDGVLLISASVSVVAAIRLVTVWSDFGDSTCGALYRPSHWQDGSFCRQFMHTRLGLVLALIALAVALASIVAYRYQSRERAHGSDAR